MEYAIKLIYQSLITTWVHAFEKNNKNDKSLFEPFF